MVAQAEEDRTWPRYPAIQYSLVGGPEPEDEVRMRMGYETGGPGRSRRRGDFLVRGLVLVGVVALLGGAYVWYVHPRPLYPRVTSARGGER